VGGILRHVLDRVHDLRVKLLALADVIRVEVGAAERGHAGVGGESGVEGLAEHGGKRNELSEEE